MSLEEKEARKAEELFTTILRAFFGMILAENRLRSRQPRLLRLLLSQTKVSIRLYGEETGKRCHLIAPGARQPKQLRDQIRTNP